MNGWWKYPYHVLPAASYARPPPLFMPLASPLSTSDSQAFNWVPTPSSDPQSFTYALFLRKLRDHLSLVGIDPSLYAVSLFSSRGASFAYQSGVPIELIKGTMSRLCARANAICFRTVILTRQDFLPDRTAHGDLLFIFSSNILDF